MHCTRRRFLLALGTTSLVANQAWPAIQSPTPSPSQESRLRGMLLGSLIGDAAGGPVEFEPHEKVRGSLTATRDWHDDRQLTVAETRKLAKAFRLLPYDVLRPDPAPYAHWTHAAAAGTVTDDSRHKFLLLAALRNAVAADRLPIREKELAREYVDYCEGNRSLERHPNYRPLCEEWLREYVRAARWLLGERDPTLAAPPSRLWGGVPTNAGQMALLPLAGAYAGDPAGAYRASFSLGFMDNGTAKDLNAAIVAGLAAAIGDDRSATAKERWQLLRETMLNVDPFRYGEIPWVPRPTVRWVQFAERAAKEAAGSPKRLFQILERDAEPRFHWDAHFVLASVWSMLVLCKFDGLAAMQLSLDFGHDTDSAAQLAGAFAGAVHGHTLFAEEMRAVVTTRLLQDYDESLDEWVQLLSDLRGKNCVAGL